MPALLHPGVYVVEVPSGVRTIEGVPTSTTIFVGETERGPTEVTKIKGREEYERLFGGYLRHTATAGTYARVTMAYAMDAFFQNGGSTAYILRAVSGTGPDAATRLSGSDALFEAASPGAWGNDVHAVVLASSDGDTARFRVAVYYLDLASGEYTFVEDWDRLSLDDADENYVDDVLERSAYIRWGGEVTAVPAADTTTNPNLITGDTLTGSGAGELNNAAKLGSGTGGDDSYTTTSLDDLLAGLDGVDDAALLVCASDRWLNDSAGTFEADLYGAFRTYVDLRPKQDLFYIADPPSQENVATATLATAATADLLRSGTWSSSTMVGVYWPHVNVGDPVGVGRNPTLLLPAASFVAGLFARTDSRRGVWKAPAGTEAVLGGIDSVGWTLLDTHSDDLNPAGINAIRVIPGAGTVIWGARTTRPTTEWRYVPVRRTAMFLRKSIYNGIQWAVFEPNDEDLWASLRATIGGFMETQFRNGAFAGSTSKDAYFVKCDASTTTELDQINGVVNVLVGFAPLRPAEFVVVKLSQKTSLTS